MMTNQIRGGRGEEEEEEEGRRRKREEDEEDEKLNKQVQHALQVMPLEERPAKKPKSVRHTKANVFVW